MNARHLVTVGAGLSLLAALIHAWVMPEHLADLRWGSFHQRREKPS